MKNVKSIYLLASLAAVMVSSNAMASHAHMHHEVPSRGLRVPAETGPSHIPLASAHPELQRLVGANLLEQPLKGQAGKAEADAAISGADAQKANINVLHQAMPKDHATGKAYQGVANTLAARSELFKDIRGRYDHSPQKFRGSTYEKQLADNMISLKKSQKEYIDAVKLKAPQSVQKLNETFKDMNEALEKEYLNLLKAL